MFLTLLVCNGRAMIIMANQFPYSKFTGYDISKEAIKNAQSQSLTYDNKNVEFDVKDVSIFQIPQKGLSFSLIRAFKAFHDQADPSTVLRNIVC